MNFNEKKFYSKKGKFSIVKKDAFEAKKKEFRISARHVIMTYPKCFMPIEEVLTNLRALVNFDRYIIVQEDHKDLTPHFHVYIRGVKKIEIKNANLLNIVFNDVEYHGNYQKSRSPRGSIEYILKTVDSLSLNSHKLLCSEDLRLMISESGIYEGLDRSLVNLAREGKISEAMELLESEDISKFLNSGEKVRKRLMSIYVEHVGFEPRFSMKNFALPLRVEQALEVWFKSVKENNAKVLLLLGSSGSGKTELLLTYIYERFKVKPHLISCYDGISKVLAGEGIIYDDFNWDSLVRAERISLLDYNRKVVNIKNGSTVIEANSIKAITANWYPFDKHDPALSRRLIIVDLNDLSLFTSENNVN